MKTKPLYLDNNDPWFLAEDIIGIDFQFSQLWLSSFVNDLEKSVGINYQKILSIYNGYNLAFYYGKDDSDNFAKHVLDMIKKDPSFGQKINDNIRIYSDELKNESRNLSPENLENISNEDLAKLYKHFDDIHTTLYTWGWLPNAVDMFHGNFTTYLKGELSKILPQDKINETLVTLTISPEKSIIQQEHESFLKLIKEKQNNGESLEFKNALEKHIENYFYLKHMWVERTVYDQNYYLEEIEKYISAGKSAADQIEKEEIEFQNNLHLREMTISKLNLNPDLKTIFDVYAEFAVTKLYRRDAQIYWAYKMDFIFDELVKRLNIDFITSRYLMPDEVDRSLRQGYIDQNLTSELDQRIKYCAYYAEKDYDLLVVNDEAKKLESKISNQESHQVEELTGQTACLGIATGKVCIINSAIDMVKMNPGDILVSIATNPDIVPAMKKAAAIITEQGGITSHAAIVSRELNTPCIIGTKIATKALKDGDMVEVDANKGMVKIIKEH